MAVHQSHRAGHNSIVVAAFKPLSPRVLPLSLGGLFLISPPGPISLCVEYGDLVVWLRALLVSKRRPSGVGEYYSEWRSLLEVRLGLALSPWTAADVTTFSSDFINC